MTLRTIRYDVDCARSKFMDVIAKQLHTYTWRPSPVGYATDPAPLDSLSSRYVEIMG